MHSFAIPGIMLGPSVSHPGGAIASHCLEIHRATPHTTLQRAPTLENPRCCLYARLTPSLAAVAAGLQHMRRSRWQQRRGHQLAGHLSMYLPSLSHRNRSTGLALGQENALTCQSGPDVDLASRSQELIFFGGKGGVGKTSSSAAYAAGLAERGRRVLILSTDPAHSLGDALAEPLTGKPKEVADNLWAAEVDTAEALKELRDGLKALDAKSLLDGLGLPGGTTAALGLNELSELLESPPPGVDELTAIARAAADTDGYDVVVFDTAPTGHTLRLLEVPDFLGNFLDRILSIRRSVGSVLDMFSFGATDKTDSALDEAEAKIRAIRERVSWLNDALKTKPGSGRTSAEFVVVTRPTALDCREAERLISELKNLGVCCRRMIINQIINADSGMAYWDARFEAQQKVLGKLRQECTTRGIVLAEVADRPESLVGVPALGYLASLVFDANNIETPNGEVLLFGGKGGVGKTSMSSALSVRLSNAGEKVLIISTDPAHSLGDALGMVLSENPAPVEGFQGAGELLAMEVDTGAAMQRFQAVVNEALQRRKEGGGIVGQVLEKLPMDDFVKLFDTLPPGSDEVVALVEILDELKKEKFDRIIIDTAPTGHALRLLTYPEFLERFADRIARLRDKFGWLSNEDEGPDRLRSFQFRMIELLDTFADPNRTAFCIVTIPTVLALEESKRLMAELAEQDIRIGMVLANRILDVSSAQESMSRLLETQRASLDDLEALARKENISASHVPYLDREVQGIYGLKYLGMSLMQQEQA